MDHVRLVPGLSDVLLATTEAACDTPLFDYCRSHNIPVFRGSEPDVLDRYYQAAKSIGTDAVMRITGDCPLLDPVVSGKVLDAFLSIPACDYASNGSPSTYPDGLDTEVVRFGALEWMWQNTFEKPYREHVTYFIRTHSEKFKTTSVQNPVDLSGYRWTLDEAADYNLLDSIAKELIHRQQFGHMSEVLAVLADHPEFMGINRHIGRDEGLAKSLLENPLTK